MLCHLRNLNLNLLASVLVFFVHLGASGPVTAPAQAPFKSTGAAQDASAGDLEDTSNLIFESLHALMKTWPHAFAPNGHAAVPATVKPGTLLYHAGNDPSGTDWMAFNAEHSYIFGGGMKTGSPYHHAQKMYTYAATRPLRVLYFDGFSASKQGGGVLDLQNVIVYGEAHGGGRDWGYGDIERGKLLCEWGSQYGIEGFVREEATYELVWCDFSVGLQLLGVTEMLIPAAETNPPAAAPAPALTHTPNHNDLSRQLSNGTGQWPDLSQWATPYYLSHAWSMYHAAAWHHARPDTRVTLHPEYLVTLYDPAYASLAANNRRPRLAHGLGDLSDADQDAFLAELDGALRAWNGGGGAKGGGASGASGASGVDWVAIAQTVVDRTGGTLAELHALLAQITDVPPAPNAAEVVSTARLVVFALLMPYIDHAALFAPGITTAERSSVLAGVSKRCGVALTGHIAAPAYQLTPQERRLKHAVEGVLQRICGFSSGVLEEALDLLEPSSKDQIVARRKLAIAKWREGVQDLMGWLGWAMWERCPRMCGWDEQCYIPMWPLDILDERERVPEPLVPRCIKREDFKQ